MRTDAPYLGIDFGTTNSAMAFYDPDRGEAKVLRNAEREYETSSLVYFGEEGEILVGKGAEDKLREVEHSSDPKQRSDVALRIVGNAKRRLLEPVAPVPVRKPVRPVEVVAKILGKLKRDAEKEHFNRKVRRVVLTCPATFRSGEQKALRRAAERAGFEEVELFEEPTAAAVAFSRLGQEVGRGVLVYDLGAGTFDLAVVVRGADGSFGGAMQPVGDARCGGNDFDLALYDYWDAVTRRELGRPVSLTGDPDQVFLQQCRERKENLSVSKRSRFSSLLPSEDGVQQFAYEADRETFEGLIRGRVERTVQMTANFLKEAQSRGHEVDAVVLIGGSSRIPLVERMLGERLSGVEVRSFSEKDYAVALGAAYRAFELWGPRQPPEKPEEAYRKAVEEALADGRVTDIRELADELGALGTSLRLDARTASDIEREVLGGTVSGIRREQREARVLAREHGIDLSGARGSGKGGWVTVRDVQQYVEQLEREEKEREERERKAQEQRRRQQQDAQERKERERKASEHVDEGHALRNQGRYQEAVEAFGRAVSIDPDNAATWHHRGWALHQLGRYQEAVDAFDRALRIDPTDALACDSKGLILAGMGRDQEAMDAFDRALRIDPNYADACNNKGVILRSLGRYQEALEAYERALRIDPKDALAQRGREWVLQDLDRH